MYLNKGLLLAMFNSIFITKLNKVIRCCTLLLCLFTITGFNYNSKRPILDIYNEAMASKSSDPKLSQELLFKLNYRREELTQEQRIDLVYLTGYLKTMRGEYYRALEVHQNLTLIGKPHIALRAYANMMQIKVLMRDYGGASQYISKIEGIINDESLVIPSEIFNGSLIGIISFYNQLGQHKQAKNYLDFLYKYDLTPREKCFADVQLTQTKVHLGIIALTDKSILDTQHYCLSLGEEPLAQNYIADLAYIYINNAMYKNAIKILEQEIGRSETIQLNLNKAEFNAYLAFSYKQLGNNTLAKKYALNTLQFAETLSEPLPKKLAYDVLYRISLEQNNSFDAIKYLRLYNSAYDEYTHIIHLKSLGLEQAKLDFMPIEEDVELYNNQLRLNNSMLDIEQEGNNSFRRYQLIQLALEVLFLLFFTYQFYSIYQITKNIKRAKHNLAYDPTTLVYHRHDFIKKSVALLEKQKLQNHLCGLLILNLDNLAKINLTHNTDRGEWVIKYGIRACKGVCTKDEIFGRLGGDEFAILITQKSLVDIKIFADRILETFQQLDTSRVSYRFDSRCSIGLTNTMVSGHSLQKLLKDADIAVRVAKDQGKNRVVNISDIEQNNMGQVDAKLSASPSDC